MAVSFDLFGTLVDVTRPDDPAMAVARELRERGVSVPDAETWRDAYREPHVDAPSGAEVPLHAHVARALASCGVDAPGNAPRRAVVAAFDPDVTRRPGALEAVRGASDRGPVAVCSNCAVPQLVRTTLVRADLRDAFDAVVSSVACGWRKPDARIFERTADALDAASDGDVPVDALVHVGDSDADAGVETAGGRFVDVREHDARALDDAVVDALVDRAEGVADRAEGVADRAEGVADRAEGVADRAEGAERGLEGGQ